MGPNDVELVRVFTRRVGAQVCEATLSSWDDFEVVLVVEAGSAIFEQGGRYQTDIVVRDLSRNDNIPYEPGPITGALGDPPWIKQGRQLVYTVRGADLEGRAGDLGVVYAYLLAGEGDPEAEFASSPFLIRP